MRKLYTVPTPVDTSKLPPTVPCLAPPTPVDRERSRFLGRKAGAMNKHCYQNASNVVLKYPNQFAYAEGFAVTDGGFGSSFWAFEHARAVDVVSSVVVDPTPCYNDIDVDVTYFPVRTWTAAELRAIIADKSRHGPTGSAYPLVGFVPRYWHYAEAWYVAQAAATMHGEALHIMMYGKPVFATQADREYFLAPKKV